MMKKKFLIVFLSALMVVITPAIASATDKTRDEALAWAQSQVGKALDYDGAYGAQCVDLIKYYYAYLGVTPVLGNGCDYATNALPDGWQRLQGATPEPGDILVYSGTTSNPAGHVAIYESDYSHYNQNVSGKQWVVKCTWHYAAYEPYWGVIRPNFAGKETPSQVNWPDVTPGNEGSNTIISWSAATNATDYDVYIYKQGDSSYYHFGNTKSTSYSVLLPAGTYEVEVVSCNKSNGSNVYAGNAHRTTFTVIGTPTIKSNVTYMHTNDSAIISWNAVSNADHYTYYLTEYPTGYAYTTNTATGDTKNNSVTFNNLTSGKYSCFIHAVSSQGTSSKQSNWVTFNVYEDDYIPTKSLVYNNHIYALYDYEMSWSFARDLCKDMGGHLVTITSSDEENAVEGLISHGTKAAYWLGASDIDNSDKVYSWVTDEKFSYSNWKSGEPSATGDKGTKEHFAEIRKSYNNQWNDVNNISKSNKGFILEIEVPDYEPTVSETFSGNQYMVFDKNTTWSEAESFCEALGGHLLTFNSEAEKEFISGLMQNGNRLWYYIGGQKINGTWQWYDGTEAQYISWAQNASGFTGTNLMMYKSTNCIGVDNSYYPASDMKNIGFVCEIENSAPIPTEEPETPTPTVKPTNPPVTDGATVKVSDATVSAGGTATVTIDLSGSNGFANLGLEVGYDSSVLTLTEAQNNTNIGAIYTPAQALTANPYNFGWNGTSNVDFNGNLITLTFKVADNAEEKTYPITVCYYKGVSGSYTDGEDVNYDADFNSLDLSYINGSITVSSHKPGDINGDGKVNNQDGTYLLRYLAGWSVDIDSSALDVNGDGKVNNQDGTVLLRYLAGWSIDIH